MIDDRPLALLVQLPIPPPGAQPVRGNVPLAAAYLTLHARRSGLEKDWRIEIFPAALTNTLGDQGLVEALRLRRPTLVGFTCYVWNIDRTLWIARRLKQAVPDVRILLGGPEVTADNDWVCRAPAIDYAAVGEGEQTFVDLLASLRTGGDPSRPIPGLWRPMSDGPPPRAELPDLDALSSPYTEGILDAADEGTMLLETVRGCRYRCKYCYYPKSSHSIRRISAERIAANLQYADQRGVGEVFLLDPTLNGRPHFDRFLGLLAQGNPNRRFTFSAELRAEGIDPSTARLLREANFQEVEVGLQSVDPRTQQIIGRPIDLAAFERGATAMLDAGIRVRIDLILGLPGDTVDSVRRGFDFLERFRPRAELQIFNLSILPGTDLRKRAERLGLDFQRRPPYYCLKTADLDIPAMVDLMDEAQDRFGIEFDMPPPPELPPAASDLGVEPVAIGLLDLDDARGADAFVPAARRAQAFTLWLRSADFHARRHLAAEWVANVLRDNPHTTLQVVVDPTDEPQRVTPDVLDLLLETCHESLSYLDWYYSLHPGRLLGAKRLVVLAPPAVRDESAWTEAVQERATLLWKAM